MSVVAATGGGRWESDPTGRHELRFHDGLGFTPHVCDGGVVASDPLGRDGATAPHLKPPAAAPIPPGPVEAPPSYRYPPPPTGRDWSRPSSPPGTPYTGYAVYPGPGPTPSAVRPRRTWTWVVVGLAVVEALVIVVLAVLLASRPASSSGDNSASAFGSTVGPVGSYRADAGRVVYSNRFGPDQGWVTGQVNGNTNVSLSAGRYVVSASGRVHHPLLTPYGIAHAGMSIRVTTAGYPESNLSMGAGCQSNDLSPPLVYQLSLFPDGQWFIEEARLGGSVRELDSGGTTPLGPTATLQLTCVLTGPSGNQTTEITAFVGGTEVGAIGDRIAGQAIEGFEPLLVTGSYGPSVKVAFTSVTVREVAPQR